MSFRVVTFGEIMLRLSPPGYQRFVQASSFEATYGGGEANVAVSKVPSHEIGQCAVNALRSLGVHTDYILRGGERLGIYFCETGASQRPSRVIYVVPGRLFSTSSPANLIDQLFSTEPVGFTSQVSPLHWVTA